MSVCPVTGDVIMFDCVVWKAALKMAPRWYLLPGIHIVCVPLPSREGWTQRLTSKDDTVTEDLEGHF